MVYILISVLIYVLIYKQLRLYINLNIKKQHILILRNANLYSILIWKV